VKLLSCPWLQFSKKSTPFNSRQFTTSISDSEPPIPSRRKGNLESLGLGHFGALHWAGFPKRSGDPLTPKFIRARILQHHLAFSLEDSYTSSTPKGKKQLTRLPLRIIAMSYYPSQGFSGAAPHQSHGYPPQSYPPGPGYPPQQGYGPPGPAYGGGYGPPPPQQAPYGYNVGIISSPATSLLIHDCRIHRPKHKEVTGMDTLHLSNQTAIQVLGLECQLQTAILTPKGTHTLLDLHLHPQLLRPSAVGHPPDIVSHLPCRMFR